MDIENRLVVAGGGGAEGGMEWEAGVRRSKLSHVEWINNKVPLYSKETYLYSMSYDKSYGKEHTKKRMYIHMTESLCFTEIIDTL